MYTNLSLSIMFGKIFCSGFKYRDRTTIIGEILDTISSDPRGRTKTSIMRNANLNLEQVNTYLLHLILLHLIKPVDPIKSREEARYKLTEEGLRLTRNIETWRYTLMPANPK